MGVQDGGHGHTKRLVAVPCSVIDAVLPPKPMGMTTLSVGVRAEAPSRALNHASSDGRTVILDAVGESVERYMEILARFSSIARRPSADLLYSTPSSYSSRSSSALAPTA